MKSIELRIGNLIMYNGGQPDDEDELTLVSIEELKWSIQSNNEFNKVYKPIPLTEEWFLKFQWQIVKGNDYFFNSNFSLSSRCLYYCNDFTGVTIKYVHQLQNLYFALTNEELIIK